ncbi:MAG: hypothetical protein JW965_04010 [Bacteroidales bacterium]|nr:hypothetical protein [Bacteroidales bacterium]
MKILYDSLYYILLISFITFNSCDNPIEVNVDKKGSNVTLENRYCALTFDCSVGSYSVTDKLSGRDALTEAKLRINDLSSDDDSFIRSWGKRRINDVFGKGLALDVTLEKQNSPRLFFSFILYENYGFIRISGGIENTTKNSLQVKEIYAVSDAHLYEGTNVSENFAMVDGFSGGEPLEYGARMYSPLTRSNALKSRNNILLTFTNDGERETLVLGGLTYADFEKFAYIEQPRRIELEKGIDGKCSLLCYLDLPADSIDQKDDGVVLQIDKKGELQTWHYHEFRCDETANSVKLPGEIIIHANNIIPDKHYILGFSWWNGYWHGNHEDNYQSVFVEYPDKGVMKRTVLVENQILPRFDGRKKEDVEQVEFLLPGEVTKAGKFSIIITKGNGPEKDQYVYLSEIWLRDGSFKPLIPDVLTPVKESIRPRLSYTANLFARDPVGKRVDPGNEYRPSDCFYIDVVSTDPLIALEDYGKNVSKAQKIELSMYDFPSVCLWYAENSYYGGSKAENSTLGAVNEMKLIKKSGFLRYSRAAVRLVPDSYLPDNQQGWWDDEHWQMEETDRDASHNGRYVKPYETSEKWGKAVTDLGGIPLTYFQTAYRSEDYAKKFPGHMLFNKTYAWKDKEEDVEGEIFTDWHKTWTRNGRVVWGYDYTDPDFQEHLTRVYRNLKKGNIKGLMFDYPASGWAKQGGMEDKYSTTAAAYRNIFRYPVEGLGPGAYVNERNMERGTDISIGLVASMRTENDTDLMDSTTVTRCGMRWYKNRVLYNQDTDSKNIARLQDNRDYVRAVLTMAYVVTGRLLLANSFEQFTPETLWDITRTFPYHAENKSARPVDAFVSASPKVYDFEVDPQWHQVTFYNPDFENSRKIGIKISGQPVDGALGLKKNKSYYVYDFWNDNYVGKLKGSMLLEQQLRAGEARMMSVRECLNRPQVLSTDRHIMQGYIDMVEKPVWNQKQKVLYGVSSLVEEDPYSIVIALNGYKIDNVSSTDSECTYEYLVSNNNLVKITLLSDQNRDSRWEFKFSK